MGNKCSWCGVEYDPDDTEGRSRIFCSKKCMDEAKADYLCDQKRDERMERNHAKH